MHEACRFDSPRISREARPDTSEDAKLGHRLPPSLPKPCQNVVDDAHRGSGSAGRLIKQFAIKQLRTDGETLPREYTPSRRSWESETYSRNSAAISTIGQMLRNYQAG